MYTKIISFTMIGIIAQAILLTIYSTNNIKETTAHTIVKPGIYVIVVDSKGKEQMYAATKVSKAQ